MKIINKKSQNSSENIVSKETLMIFIFLIVIVIVLVKVSKIFS